MRNVEQIEHELTKLKGNRVFVIIPMSGMTSLSMAGDLQLVETQDHMVGFHLTGHDIALIFFAEDVQSLEAPLTEGYVKTIRMLKKA